MIRNRLLGAYSCLLHHQPVLLIQYALFDPRVAAACASAWPGGSSLSRKPPPEGTGAAPGATAKPPTPVGAAVAAAAAATATAAEARHPPSRIGARAAAATRIPEERRRARPGAQGCGGTTEVQQAGILSEASSVGWPLLPPADRKSVV